ncbi:MAG: ammonia channel protein [Candidatus Lambdaproteobacteria bacterium RIFOXYD1_FULL_56_27]|uniref:Ammonium transporter n=1 Tax=Candidatus Lambdaproteobacteria bacterium RIFOXYD2_FULL_56_26 TaxID=1817773 RepID=A0A1F6GYK9_9PROT|nr:MAG: ammonia channel protein [Candidatus Lambdaproteobacteria bacterium RIFOXYC1_FULL_56_13]OGH03237.1 MAG: ammonia channel protein [Candidatus Lambdaproteobacteria bacterium RIFOXYD2_FULL_56_26]OGH08174.1 MAG: ammonia channel protein [Candidatus Lambdaproteobacteria bacterium RIFOXYD1_FULL_56_27]
MAKLPFLIGILLSSPGVLMAAEIDKADTAWMLISTALVMFMVPGLALFYGGLVRSMNVLSVVMQSLFAMGLMGLQWAILGYSLAWGSDHGGFVGGLEYLFLDGVGQEANGTIPHVLFMMFQGMFAIITPALIGGSVVERIKFSSFCLFILAWGTLVYDPLCHMVWHPQGFLLTRGSLDFAGGTVVHISSGVSALVLALMVGKRKGYGKQSLPPHNLLFTLIGGALLWFGWFGFNAGSALSSGGLAANALVTTFLSAAAGLFSWTLAEWILIKKPSVLGALSGMLAGLVAITPAAGFVGPGPAILIGLVGGLVCYLGVRIKTRFGFDDSLDAFGVHGIGGIFGALATGLFASALVNPAGTDGVFYNLETGLHLLGEQILAIGVTVVYSVVVTFLLGKAIDLTLGLRVTEEEETQGLDATLHGESAYQS